MTTIRKNMDATGTSLQGYLRATYNELVAILGEPSRIESSDGKVSCQWCFGYGFAIVTLYDYKESSPNVCRRASGYLWHIGGNGSESVDAIQNLFPNNDVLTEWPGTLFS